MGGLKSSRRIGAREPAAAVGGPLHGRAHAVAVAEINVVAHADLVAVIDDGRSREREQQAVHQFDAAAVIVHEGRQAAPDSDVDAHLRIGAVGQVHVVPLFVGDHLQGQLVVVAQEQAPLARLRNLRRLGHDFGDGMPVLQAQRHEDARHQRKVKCHVALVALSEIGAHIGRPLVGFRQEHAFAVLGIQRAPDAPDHLMRFAEVFAVGALPLHQVRNGVQAHPVSARDPARTAWPGPPRPARRGCRSSGPAGARRSDASSTPGPPGPTPSWIFRCR